MSLLVLSRSFREEERSFLAEKAPSRWASGYKVELWRLLIKVKVKVQLFVAPWAIQSMEFFRQDYRSGLPFHSPGDLPNPRVEPRSPALQANYLPSEPPGKPKNTGVGSLSLLYPFSRRSSWPRNRTGVSCILGRFFTNWALGKLNFRNWC